LRSKTYLVENIAINKTPTPWLSIGLVAVLLALAPYAMSLRPFEGIYADGVYRTAHTTDALFMQRFALVILGLSAAIVTFWRFVVSLIRTPKSIMDIAPLAAAALACAVVGWRLYPYWVEGVYQVQIGAAPSVNLDPKALMPMMWIAELWRLPVLLLSLICFVAIPLLAMLSIRGIWQRRFVSAGLTAACTAIAAVFMVWFSPDYVTWLMD
jgi:uncharacterized protein with PQ loop repeat